MCMTSWKKKKKLKSAILGNKRSYVHSEDKSKKQFNVLLDDNICDTIPIHVHVGNTHTELLPYQPPWTPTYIVHAWETPQ